MERILDPLPVDDFFENLGRASLDSPGGADHPRARLFGEDPEASVLGAFATHAAILDCHGVNPSGPPPPAVAMPDSEAFRALIGSFHDRGYTVRVPDVLALSPELRLFARALEFLLHQPVTASVFWSRAGAGANVHFDDNDNIVIQLSGRKKWFLSTDPPRLQNKWKDAAAPLPKLDPYRTLEVGPGDLIYIPRGLSHTVQSLTDSLHVSILFTPITVREAMIAAIDHLSDLDRPLRETAIGAIGAAKDGEMKALQARVAEAAARLAEHCGKDGFVEAAMERRSSRMIGELPRPDPGPDAPALTPDTILEHHPLAVAHLLPAPQSVDLALPGGHVFIHRGAEPALAFIRDTARFRVRDIPGLADDVRIALAARLIAAGFLRPGR